MEEQVILTSEELYRGIISLIVESPDSPYKRMMRKAKDIDLDYFDSIPHNESQLSPELNPELKDKIVSDFEKMADHYYVDSKLEERLLAFVMQEATTAKDEADSTISATYLKELVAKLQEYAGEMQMKGWPRYPDASVRERYENAKEITFREFLFGNNYKDVLDFYSALMDNTWWECQELILKRTKTFLLQLAIKLLEVADAL